MKKKKARFKCPNCTNLRLQTKVEAELDEFGKAKQSSIIWVYNRPARCATCGFSGIVNDFDVE